MDPEKTREFVGRLIERKPHTFLIILLLTALACRLTPAPTPQPATSSALAPGMQIGIDAGIWTLIKALFSGHQVVEIQG